ncbi:MULTISPECIES: hypothetical protein [Saliphagus]|uniref:Uncharacterized protein n=1 Tax=Saliphagus infecundisoli TaxID=1849069 RepID=A0ABD5QEA2_9EURY|nr:MULTISPECIES: hypothetical protein [Saliphagus]
MTSPPQERETYTIALDREERWVVHHVLTDRIDDRIDDGERPPERLLDLVSRIEDGEKTLTGRQLRTLQDALRTYAGADGTPSRDVELASAVAARLEALG